MILDNDTAVSAADWLASQPAAVVASAVALAAPAAAVAALAPSAASLPGTTQPTLTKKSNSSFQRLHLS